MVANMTAISVKQHQLSAPSSKGAADHHQYSCLLKTADTVADSLVTSRAGIIPLPDESSNSWEARAFAEDASSLAAGIWPPRAYPCSFCRREFRSAQALGGHMNVHRRDRARLRHSSPPSPFRAPLHRPQVSSLIQAQQYTSPTLSNPSTCPNLYPNESLSKLNSLPSARSMSSMAPATSSASLSAIFPSDITTSFPLRLHILASEAASTLMFPQAEPSDLLSLWPTSTIDSANACQNSNLSAIKAGSTIDISSSSLSSSSSIVAPSTGAIPCRRTGDIIQPADESPKKRSNLTNKCTGFQPYQIIKFTNFSHGAESDAHQTQIKGDEDIQIERKREDCGDVDLELRLGRRPP